MVVKCMSYALTHNSQLNAVLSPCIVDESFKFNEDCMIRLRTITMPPFFTDDTQHGLCIYLGLAELLGLDLERDMNMKDALYVVRSRRLQHTDN